MNKQTRKLLIIISIIVVLLIIIACIVAYFVYQNNNLNQSVGTTWGDAYYAYLREGIGENNEQEKEKYGIYSNVTNVDIEFIEIENNNNPVMVMSYYRDSILYSNIYYINEQNTVNSVLNKEYTDLILLYNIEEDGYFWYLHDETDVTDSYTKITNIVNYPNSNEADYTIGKDEMISTQTSTGLPITVTRYSQIFVDPEVKNNPKTRIQLNNISVEQLRDDIERLVNEWTPIEEMVTDEVAEDVSQQLQTSRYITSLSGVDVNEIGEGAIIQTENNEIVAGNYTLQYGRYVDQYGTEYILNEDRNMFLPINIK